MSEWADTKLGDLVELSSGGTPSLRNPAYWGGDIPWMSAASMTSLHLTRSDRMVTQAAIGNGTKIAPKGSILVVVRGMSLRNEVRVGKAARDVAFNQDLKALCPIPSVDADFLLYTLHGRQDELLRMVRSATNGTGVLPTELLVSLPVKLPSLADQRRIVAVMSAVDAQIEALVADQNALQSMYSNAIGLLWLDDSGVEVPFQRLGEHLTLDVARIKVDPDADYPIAGVLNAGRGLIARETIKGAATDYSTLNLLSAGHAVMRKLTAWEGTVTVIPSEFDGFYASAEFPTFALQSSLSGRYFAHVCRSPRLWHEMKNRVTGTVQRRKRLNPDQLLDVALPIPSRETQDRVAAGLDGMNDLLGALASEIAALLKVRADLLTAVLSREITVGEAVDRSVEGAA